MKISFIGAGNAAWQLSRSLENAGNSVMEVFSRHASHAKDLVHYLYNAHVQEHLDFSESISNVFFVCIPESAYAQVLPELILPPQATLVLVTGQYSILEANMLYDPSRESTNEIGIFYPVQYLQKGVNVKMDDCPICIEAINPTTVSILIELGKSISKDIYSVSDDERKKIHLASLLAGGFTRMLWHKSEELLKEVELDNSLILPLIKNHLANFNQHFPYKNRAEKEQLQASKIVNDQKELLNNRDFEDVYEHLVKLLKKSD